MAGPEGAGSRVHVGFEPSGEEHRPSALVGSARLAERAGFESAPVGASRGDLGVESRRPEHIEQASRDIIAGRRAAA